MSAVRGIRRTLAAPFTALRARAGRLRVFMARSRNTSRYLLTTAWSTCFVAAAFTVSVALGLVALGAAFLLAELRMED